MNWAECNNYNDCQDDKKEIVTYCEIACASPLKCICRQGETAGKLKLISTTRDSYTVYLDNTTIGTVRRIHEASNSETQWKAEAIGWVYNKFGFNTKTEAAEALESAYRKGRGNPMTEREFRDELEKECNTSHIPAYWKAEHIISLIKQAGYAKLASDQSLPDGGFYETTPLYNEAIRILLRAGWQKVETG